MKLTRDPVRYIRTVYSRTELVAAERTNVEAAGWKRSDQDGSFLALDRVNNSPGPLNVGISPLAICETIQPPQQTIHPALDSHRNRVSGVIEWKASDQF
jgi:hypothetical protein